MFSLFAPTRLCPAVQESRSANPRPIGTRKLARGDRPHWRKRAPKSIKACHLVRESRVQARSGEKHPAALWLNGAAPASDVHNRRHPVALMPAGQPAKCALAQGLGGAPRSVPLAGDERNDKALDVGRCRSKLACYLRSGACRHRRNRLSKKLVRISAPAGPDTRAVSRDGRCTKAPGRTRFSWVIM